ncbi:MAG: hypothetical protein ACJ781_04310 [Myxococcales bacterium]
MRKVLVPLGAFAAARLLLAAAARAEGYPPFAPGLFRRWDSGQYLSIAARGYDLVECARIGYAPEGWCGNAGWMPGYPALIAAAVRVGATPLVAGVAISAGFEIALLVLLWNGLFERKSFFALLACALAPGAIYFHAVFPISLCAFFVALSLWLLLRDRFALAGLSGAAAAASYSTGFLIAPVAALWALSRPGSVVQRVGRAVVAGGLSTAGLVAVFAWHQAKLGAWDAFLRVQAKYDHRIVSPFSRIVAQAERRDVVGAETLLVAALFVALAIFCVWRGPRGRDLLLLGCGAVFWLFPLFFKNVELARSEALFVPALVLLDDAPVPVAACACAALGALAWPIAQLFYRGVLV